MNMKSVLAEELKLISLSREEVLRLEKIAKDFVKSLKGEGLKAFVGGSLAKGTLIRKTSFSNQSEVGSRKSEVRESRQDVDVFVVFDYSEDILKLEKILSGMKLPGELKKVHGSRDYFQIECDDCLLEVIPVVKNRDPELAENITDVSLSHVKYVVGEIKKNVGIADEIKLAKAFCRAQRCYGAESYVHGFSGYSLEVLVIYFGGFKNFLKKICGGRNSAVGGRVIIDPLKYFRGEREVMSEINSSKLNSPIVVVDPTYRYRNVTAGLGLETYERFVGVASDFLKRPSLDFFKLREIDVKALRDLTVGSRRFVEVDLSTNRQEGDIAGTKMKKLLDFFVRELERKGQVVLRKEFDYSGFGQRAKGYIVVLEVKEIEVRGPSVGLENASKAFLKSNCGSRLSVVGSRGDCVYKKKGFWWVKKEMSVEKVFELVKRVEEEMGAKIEDFC
ncbi:MAG: hypothetical protein KJ592_00705 [Nanoarchaeota archaeon]|nr:hypothetical protein [Nanoarchaeota archaeon]